MIPTSDRTVVAGIPTTKVERTLLDLAAVVGDDAVEQALEAAYQNALVLAGWTVLRFTWADVTERPSEVVAVVSRAGAA